MLYIEAKALVDAAVAVGVLHAENNCIAIYHEAGSQPEGWYLEDTESVYHVVMDDEDGQKALIDALAARGIDFSIQQERFQKLMESIDSVSTLFKQI